MIVRAVEKLPDAVLDQAGDIEAELVGHAGQFDARHLETLATRIHACLDPDGTLTEHEQRDRQRCVELHPRPDGSGHARGEFTAELTEVLQTVLDSLAAPQPEADGVKDPRTAGQRRHDALLDALKLSIRAGQLPDAGGITATVLLTTTAADWAAGTGLTRTGHGAYVPTTLAKQWADGDSRIMTISVTPTERTPTERTPTERNAGDKTGAYATSSNAITGLSTLGRFFTERQRLAMTARDRGCSFPGCDRPPQWCQAHHVIPDQHHGPTSTDNGTLLCGHHHRTFHKTGWTCRIRNGIPEWIPPPWIDPLQQPRTNHAHV